MEEGRRLSSGTRNLSFDPGLTLTCPGSRRRTRGRKGKGGSCRGKEREIVSYGDGKKGAVEEKEEHIEGGVGEMMEKHIKGGMGEMMDL